MNSTRLDFMRFKSTRTASQTRQAVGLLKTEKKVMKLKVQFGGETCFDQRIRRIVRSRVQLWPGNRVLLPALTMAGRPKSITHRTD